MGHGRVDNPVKNDQSLVWSACKIWLLLLLPWAHMYRRSPIFLFLEGRGRSGPPLMMERGWPIERRPFLTSVVMPNFVVMGQTLRVYNLYVRRSAGKMGLSRPAFQGRQGHWNRHDLSPIHGYIYVRLFTTKVADHSQAHKHDIWWINIILVIHCNHGSFTDSKVNDNFGRKSHIFPDPPVFNSALRGFLLEFCTGIGA